MKHLDFVLWILGWPIIRVIEKHYYYKINNNIGSDCVKLLASIIELTIWVNVGILLWKS